MPFYLGGHRGLGCTDHPHYATRSLATLPAENTLESVRQAFAMGADFVEIDAVQSADGQLFVLHNVVPADHFFGAQPAANLNTLPWGEFSNFPIGRNQTGKIASLADMLALTAEVAPTASPYVVNIELKGTQGSGQGRDGPEFIEGIANFVEDSNLSIGKVLFSSFCLQSVIDMANRLPQAQYGMLFQERALPRPIYTGGLSGPLYDYIPFTEANIAETQKLFQQHVNSGAQLTYLHPEVATLTPELLTTLAGQGWGFNTWGLFEVMDEARNALYHNLIEAAAVTNAHLALITDYLPQKQTLTLRAAG